MNRPNIFIPSNQVPEQNQKPAKASFLIVFTKALLKTFIQFLVVFLVGLLPIITFLGNASSISFDRVLFASAAVSVLFLLIALLLIFKKDLRTIVPKSFLFLLLFAGWGFVSAFMNSDLYDSMWGNEIGVQTVVFSLLLLLLVVTPLSLQFSKRMILRSLILFFAVSVLVLIHTWLRYGYGISLFDFGKLPIATDSLVGDTFDSAVYAGLMVILGLVTLVMLPLRMYAQAAVTAVMAIALVILFQVNFAAVWYSLFFLSLVTATYIVLRKPVFQKVQLAPTSGLAKVVVVLLLFVSLIGVIQDSAITDTFIGSNTEISVEPALNFSDSLEISKRTYQDDLLFGVGPNRYEDAWRLYKSAEVNQTIFWNVDLVEGHSYMSDIFTTYGLPAGLFLVLFHLGFLWFGVSRLTENAYGNIVARYLLTSSFAAALFLWAVTYLYTPSVTMMMLAALFTGLTFAAASNLQGTKIISVKVSSNRIRAFVVLILSLALIIITVVSIGSLASKYFEQFDALVESDTDNDELVGAVADRNIFELNRLIATANPQTVTQDDLLRVSEQALRTSKRAVELDPTNPRHLERLASLYSLLGSIGVSGGYDNAEMTLEKIVELDPKNPKHKLALARLALAKGNAENALMEIEEAIQLKSNYRDAIQLQIDIAISTGRVESLLSEVEDIVQLDPGNAIRWYQLGVLHSSLNQREEAIRMLLRAIQIDPSFADARYVLAFQYLAEERQAEALRQLRLVQDTNSNNAQLRMIIERIEAGEEIEMFIPTPIFTEENSIVDSGDGVSVPSEVPIDFLISDEEAIGVQDL